MNKAEQKRKQAFLDNIRAIEARHGYQLVVLQAPPQMVIQKKGAPAEDPKN